MIRDATEADLPAIRDIYNHAVLHTTAIWNDLQVDLDNRRAWHAARIARGFPVLVAGAADGAAGAGDAVLGYACYGDFRAFDGFRGTVEHSVYVAPGAQGRGLGRALLAALIDRARTQGLHVMVAAIEAGNAPSLSLHRALGFRQVGTMDQVGLKFGRWLDLTLMELRLDDRPTP